jgi:hypothetical protein
MASPVGLQRWLQCNAKPLHVPRSERAIELARWVEVGGANLGVGVFRTPRPVEFRGAGEGIRTLDVHLGKTITDVARCYRSLRFSRKLTETVRRRYPSVPSVSQLGDVDDLLDHVTDDVVSLCDGARRTGRTWSVFSLGFWEVATFGFDKETFEQRAPRQPTREKSLLRRPTHDACAISPSTGAWLGTSWRAAFPSSSVRVQSPSTA